MDKKNDSKGRSLDNELVVAVYIDTVASGNSPILQACADIQAKVVDVAVFPAAGPKCWAYVADEMVETAKAILDKCGVKYRLCDVPPEVSNQVSLLAVHRSADVLCKTLACGVCQNAINTGSTGQTFKIRTVTVTVRVDLR